MSDVSSEWIYTDNKLHPTQRPVEVLEPLIRTYCPAGGLVLNPLRGPGSTLVATTACRRDYLGIELEHASESGWRLEVLAKKMCHFQEVACHGEPALPWTGWGVPS
ncbi:UNVERIFIED_ORG: hypothetical protein J2W19_001029 [Shinella zoogloeoides]|jgi:site-specific DNA-methyltransferase (adenine-specific)|uniref:DNA methyltransferase n=1 Tax=Shinella sumterensis TaxID=1967501 RepID=UPI00277E1EAB|nr:hypothetical protein [Shinella zoogloeoides]